MGNNLNKIKRVINTSENGATITVTRFHQKTVGDFFSSCFFHLVVISLGIVALVAVGDLSGDFESGEDTGGTDDDDGIGDLYEAGFQNDYSTSNRPVSAVLSEEVTAQSVAILSFSGITKNETNRSDKFGTRGFRIDNGERRQKLFPLKNSSSVLVDILRRSEERKLPLSFQFTSGHQYEVYKKKSHFRMRALDELSVQSAKEILHVYGIQFAESEGKSTATLQWREKRGLKRLKEMTRRILGLTISAVILSLLVPIAPIVLPITVPVLLILVAVLFLREIPYLYLSIISAVVGLRASVTFRWDKDSLTYIYRKYNLFSKKNRVKREEGVALFLDRNEWASWSGGVVLTVLSSNKEFTCPLIPNALNSSKWYERYCHEKAFLIGSALSYLILSEWDSANV